MKQRRALMFLIPILLLAAALRFYLLDAQSFWNDEGNSARVAERSLGLILAAARGDIHPPGYYLFLHAWRAFMGSSEFALRSVSVFAGVVLVALTYGIGRRLYGPATGLTGALLGAVAPLAITYSQEARMYALLAALGAAASYLLLRILPLSGQGDREGSGWPPAWGAAVGYVFLGAAGLYTQYTFPFVLLVHNAFFALWWLLRGRLCARRWAWVGLWGGLQVGLTMLFLPWLGAAVHSLSGWSARGGTYALGPALRHVLSVLSIGVTLRDDQAGAALCVAGALVFLGLFPDLRIRDQLVQPGRVAGAGERVRSAWGGALLALWLVLPVVLIFAFQLYKPAYLKFLIVTLPAAHLLAAHGIENLARAANRSRARGVRIVGVGALLAAAVVLVLATGRSLYNLYFNPAYARDDYRQIAADIAAVRRAGDAIVLDAPNQWEVFTYYCPDQDVYPAPYHPDLNEAEAFLAPLLQGYDRLFVLYWGDAESDPQRLIEGLLGARAYPAGDRWYGHVRLVTYGVAPLPQEPTSSVDAELGGVIQLRGYAISGDSFAPGDVLPVTLFWQATEAPSRRYKVTLQVLDGAGQLVAQHDAEPGGGFRPTDAWEPGKMVTDRSGVMLSSDLAAGTHTVIVGVYDAASGQRLFGSDGADHLVLTPMPRLSHLDKAFCPSSRCEEQRAVRRGNLLVRMDRVLRAAMVGERGRSWIPAFGPPVGRDGMTDGGHRAGRRVRWACQLRLLVLHFGAY